MKTIILVVAVFILVFLVARMRGKTDPAAEQCAQDVIVLLRSRRDASPEDIAAVYKQHERRPDDIDQVTRLIAARLSQAHITKEQKPEVMRRVRAAKQLLAS